MGVLERYHEELKGLFDFPEVKARSIQCFLIPSFAPAVGIMVQEDQGDTTVTFKTLSQIFQSSRTELTVETEAFELKKGQKSLWRQVELINKADEAEPNLTLDGMGFVIELCLNPKEIRRVRGNVRTSDEWAKVAYTIFKSSLLNAKNETSASRLRRIDRYWPDTLRSDR